MSAIQNFAFEDHLVRIVLRDGEPWFVAKDVCGVLGLTNPTVAVANLDEDEKGLSSAYTLGGEQSVLIISESGLYTIVLRSRAAVTLGSVAHRFRKWVTGDVLPALRKTGSYETPRAAPRVETYEADSLASRVNAVEAARRLYGRAAARDLWHRLGLPQVEATAALMPDLAHDRACLDRLLSADLTDAQGVILTVREALIAAFASDTAACAILERAGIRPDAGGFWVANRSGFVDQTYAGPPWAHGTWRHALRRLP